MTVHYPKIMMLLAEISGDNGGCNVDEWEQMLQSLTDEELLTLASGEDEERKAIMKKLDAGDASEQLVDALDRWLNLAFDA